MSVIARHPDVVVVTRPGGYVVSADALIVTIGSDKTRTPPSVSFTDHHDERDYVFVVRKW